MTAHGAIHDAVCRLCQGFLYFQNILLFRVTRVNVILCSTIGQVLPSLADLHADYQLSTDLLGQI